jgi:hypothetical protein
MGVPPGIFVRNRTGAGKKGLKQEDKKSKPVARQLTYAANYDRRKI